MLTSIYTRYTINHRYAFGMGGGLGLGGCKCIWIWIEAARGLQKVVSLDISFCSLQGRPQWWLQRGERPGVTDHGQWIHEQYGGHSVVRVRDGEGHPRAVAGGTEQGVVSY